MAFPLLLPLFPTSPDLHHRPPKRRRLLLPPFSHAYTHLSASLSCAHHNTTNCTARYHPHQPLLTSTSSTTLRTESLRRFSNATTSLADGGEDSNTTALTLGDHDHSAAAVIPPPPAVDRKLRVLFEKLLTQSDVSRGQDRLLLRRKNHGCLGQGNTPSAPEWRDVALVFHDGEEMGRTWVLVHGFWPSSKAYVLKGKQWSKYRDHRELQHNDILTISVDDADGGSLWISHRPSNQVPQLQQNVAPSQNLQPVLQTLPTPKPPISNSTAHRRRLVSPQPIAWSAPPKLSPPAAVAVPRTPLDILDLNLELGVPSSNNGYPTYLTKKMSEIDDSRACKRQQQILTTTEGAPSSSASRSRECTVNGSRSGSLEWCEVSHGNCHEEAEQEWALTLLALGGGHGLYCGGASSSDI